MIAMFAQIQRKTNRLALNSSVLVPTKANITNRRESVKRNLSRPWGFVGGRSTQVATALRIGNFNNLLRTCVRNRFRPLAKALCEQFGIPFGNEIPRMSFQHN